jgi:hypothetical protein
MQTVAERFWSHVEIRNGCWEWTASRDPHGYGKATDAKRRGAMAHRLAWKIMYGPIPPGLLILHRCDNPPCVRPAHLSLGTHSDNMKDMAAKGRHRGAPPKRYGPPKPTRFYPRDVSRLSIESKLRIIAAHHEGLVQTAIAARMGITQPAVSRVLREAGYRSFDRKRSW